MSSSSHDTRDVLSSWKRDPTARDDELVVATVQWRSIERVAKRHDARAARRQAVTNEDEELKGDGFIVDVDAEEDGFSEDEARHLRRRMAPTPSPLARVRPLSATSVRSSKATTKLSLMRPQSAKGTGHVNTRRASPNLTWMPRVIKDSKWTEMLQSSPQFQDQHLQQLEAETFALLEQVLRRPSRQARHRDEAKKPSPITNRTNQSVTKKNVKEKKASIPSAAVGSGFQVARKSKTWGNPHQVTQPRPQNRAERTLILPRSHPTASIERQAMIEKTKARIKSATSRGKANKSGSNHSEKDLKKRRAVAEASVNGVQEMRWLDDIGFLSKGHGKDVDTRNATTQKSNVDPSKECWVTCIDPIDDRVQADETLRSPMSHPSAEESSILDVEDDLPRNVVIHPGNFKRKDDPCAPTIAGNEHDDDGGEVTKRPDVEIVGHGQHCPTAFVVEYQQKTECIIGLNNCVPGIWQSGEPSLEESSFDAQEANTLRDSSVFGHSQASSSQGTSSRVEIYVRSNSSDENTLSTQHVHSKDDCRQLDVTATCDSSNLELDSSPRRDDTIVSDQNQVKSSNSDRIINFSSSIGHCLEDQPHFYPCDTKIIQYKQSVEILVGGEKGERQDALPCIPRENAPSQPCPDTGQNGLMSDAYIEEDFEEENRLSDVEDECRFQIEEHGDFCAAPNDSSSSDTHQNYHPQGTDVVDASEHRGSLSGGIEFCEVNDWEVCAESQLHESNVEEMSQFARSARLAEIRGAARPIQHQYSKTRSTNGKNDPGTEESIIDTSSEMTTTADSTPRTAVHEYSEAHGDIVRCEYHARHDHNSADVGKVDTAEPKEMKPDPFPNTLSVCDLEDPVDFAINCHDQFPSLTLVENHAKGGDDVECGLTHVPSIEQSAKVVTQALIQEENDDEHLVNPRANNANITMHLIDDEDIDQKSSRTSIEQNDGRRLLEMAIASAGCSHSTLCQGFNDADKCDGANGVCETSWCQTGPNGLEPVNKSNDCSESPHAGVKSTCTSNTEPSRCDSTNTGFRVCDGERIHDDSLSSFELNEPWKDDWSPSITALQRDDLPQNNNHGDYLSHESSITVSENCETAEQTRAEAANPVQVTWKRSNRRLLQPSAHNVFQEDDHQLASIRELRQPVCKAIDSCSQQVQNTEANHPGAMETVDNFIVAPFGDLTNREFDTHAASADITVVSLNGAHKRTVEVPISDTSHGTVTNCDQQACATALQVQVEVPNDEEATRTISQCDVAATCIQRQYRRHVYRRILLDQLAFVVRQNRREARKRSRQLNDGLETNLLVQKVSEDIRLDGILEELAVDASSSSETAVDRPHETPGVIENQPVLVLDPTSIASESVESVLAQLPQELIAETPIETVNVEVANHQCDSLSVQTEDDTVEVESTIKDLSKWERYVDTNANKSFYYNPADRVSQWDRPIDHDIVNRAADETIATTDARDDTDLGVTERVSNRWERHKDTETNKSFYFNRARHVSQWERPTEDLSVVVNTVVESQVPQRFAMDKATVLESYGGWDRCLCQKSAEIFYHHKTSDEYANGHTEPGSFAVAKAELLDATSERWTLRRNQSQRGDHRGEWQAFVDTKSHQTFYYNTNTGESTWEKPPVFDLPHPTPTDEHTASYQWVMYVDATTAQPYYVNLVTQATSWERPVDFDVATSEQNLSRMHGIGEHNEALGCEEEEDGDAYVISIHDDEDANAWL